jgi:chromosome segregation ATPase
VAEHPCNQAVPIAEIKMEQKGLKEAITLITRQYLQTMEKLDTVAELLKENALNRRDIEHITKEQQAQWKRIDEVNLRVEAHLRSCKGPEQALERANEAHTAAQAALAAVSDISKLPGKWAVALIVAIGGLGSNVVTALLVSYLMGK